MAAIARSIKKLQALDLAGTHTSDHGLIQIEALNELRELNISDTNVTDKAAGLILKLRRLETLVAAKTALGDEFLSKVRPCQSWPSYTCKVRRYQVGALN